MPASVCGHVCELGVFTKQTRNRMQAGIVG
jgi:hypothetical protein